jgi:lipid-A-disaccharide synthase
MAEASVSLFHNITALAVVGSVEALGRLPTLFRAFRVCSERIVHERPQALVLVDFPEFNIRLARVARRHGIPVVYFVPPQLWAWRPWRVRTVRQVVSKVLACFPFETDFYRKHGVPVKFVGHPLLDHLPALTRDGARTTLTVGPDELLIGLLPGSRREEIARLLPVMLDAAGRVVRRKPTAQVLVALAPTIAPEDVRHLLAAHACSVRLIQGETYQVMAGADCLLVASGTATLEAACFGTPMVVCYKLSRLSYLIAWSLIRLPWISLVNIVAGREVVPELIQGQLTPERLASHVCSILEEPSVAKAQRDSLALVRERLGPPGASERAARSVLAVAGHPEFLSQKGAG